MTDLYIYIIAALLPLTAYLTVIQSNPYQVMIMRGILGSIAALLYAIWGAADVALTEALMGTLLAVTLYAITVRSSLVMNLGVIEEEYQQFLGKTEKKLKIHQPENLDDHSNHNSDGDNLQGNLQQGNLQQDDSSDKHLKNIHSNDLEKLIGQFQTILNQYYMRLEIFTYADQTSLEEALKTEKVHGIVHRTKQLDNQQIDHHFPYLTKLRIRRLYEIMTDQLPANMSVVHINQSVDPLKSQEQQS
jgi:putative multicomponent Na+:H+ antiporter subunit B